MTAWNWKHIFRKKLDGGDIAFIAVSLVSLAITLSTVPINNNLLGLLLISLLTLIETAIGIRLVEVVKDYYDSLLPKLIYYAVQSVLVTVLVLLTDGATLLMILPLAAQAVPLFEKWPPIILTSLYFGVLTISIMILVGAEFIRASQATLSIGSGIVFVILVTRIAYNAEINKEEVQRLANELREAYNQLREYAMQAEELATTKERNRVAREIHDGLGHYFTAINMQLEAARVLLPTDPTRTAEALGKAQTLTKEGLAEVRQSVAALRQSPVENKSLPEALRQLVGESEAAGIVTVLTLKGEPRPLSQPIELTLYRVVQEGLTNVRKHALASRADVILDYSESAKIKLTVQDNGKGATESGKGFGLIGIRERVQLLGGTVQQKSAPDAGFQLQVEIPVG